MNKIMTHTRRFGVRGQKLAKHPYQYRACGLDDVYLTSGFEAKNTAYGPSVTIHDIPGLHRAIGHSIIIDNKPLTAREFRFLRKNMDMTQEALAARLRVDVQTVARYEKDQTAIPGATDMVVRIMFAVHIAPPERREEIMEEVAAIIEDQLSEATGADKEFGPEGWREHAVHAH